MTDTLTLRIPRKLDTPNADRGAHWTVRHRVTKDWEKEIWAAWHAHRDWDRWLTSLQRPERRHVLITRCHPTRRTFCRDSDNRMFAGKPIRDALVRLRLLVDDSDHWLASRVDDTLGPTTATVIAVTRLSD